MTNGHGASASIASGAKLGLQRLTLALGAVVQGVSLDVELPQETIDQIRLALEEHLVLFFENQRITPAQQRDFAARFGNLYVHPFYPGDESAPQIMVMEHDAQRRANADRWHTDVTYVETPPQAAVLYAEEVPDVGGDTLWANMYRAYETLSEPVKQMITGLRAVHSFAKNFTPARFRALHMEDQMERLYADHPPVSHPVARTNPVNGRKALFVNQDFTTHIEGVSERESDAILRLLYDHMARPEFQVRWRWRPNTVAMWENRWTQHCALADYYPQRRRVRRATIIGDRPV
jgi:taurine dioxygenase